MTTAAWYPALPKARALLEEHGGLWGLPEEYRQAHTIAKQLRQRGMLLTSMPPKIAEKERLYQAVRHLERKRRKAMNNERK